jgi:hypothetical protein
MAVKPTIPEVISVFADYLLANPSWGSLHIVLEEGDVGDSQVESCRDWAANRGDKQGMELASILLTMSKSQRGRIDCKAREYLNRMDAQEDVNEGDLEDL